MMAGMVVVGLAAGGWAVAQQGRPVVAVPLPGGGPYAVSAGEEFAVLLETRTGRSWVLNQSVTGDAVWLPIQRIESDDEARAWKEREAQRKAKADAEKKHEDEKKKQDGNK
jgi:hypothetical protein